VKTTINKLILSITLILSLFSCNKEEAEPNAITTVSTIAGNREEGTADGKGAAARFFGPRGVAIDAQNNIYVADTRNHRIRKITPDGTVTTLAGTGEEGFAGGLRQNARFNRPSSLVLDPQGNIYIIDMGNNCIRKITSDGQVSTLAGSYYPGFADGKGSLAKFHSPRAITIDNANNLYVTDTENNAIRKITPDGTVSTFAGNPYKYGSADGEGKEATFFYPLGIVSDGHGNIFVADNGNRKIRRITLNAIVSTYAGTGTPGFSNGEAQSAQISPNGITINKQGDVFVTDSYSLIRKITPSGQVSTLAGSTPGYQDGNPMEAKFGAPKDLAFDKDGNLIVADDYNNCIRKITLPK